LPTVEQLLPGDLHAAASWDAFVLACPQATFFHRSGWQRLMREVFRHDTYYLFAHSGGRITGVLPLAHVRSLLFGKSLSSLPFAAYGGIAADDEDSAAALQQEAESLARRLGVAHLELRHLERRNVEWPEQNLYVTFRRPILRDVEANMQAIPRKQRAMVRKGLRNGLSSQIETTTERFFALYSDNVHRHGTPALSKRYFDELRREFGPGCEVLTVSGPDGRALSSVISFYFRNEVLPCYAGDDLAARDLAANDFKYWELMRRACERGITLFDYGRSKLGTGPFAFKKNWGFEPKPLHYEYRLYKRHEVPQNNPSNAKYRLLIEAWRRMPRGFATWLGPIVVRGLG